MMDGPDNGTAERDEDARLLAAFATGDQSAARRLVDRHAGRCLGLAHRLLRDQAEAEDVAQEAMLRLWKIAPDWRPGEARVSTWLYRVVTNLCTDRLRRRRGVGLDEVPEPEDDRPGAEADMMHADRQTALHAALDTLPERQRTAVVLRHLEERSNPEIAEIMDASVEAVESLLSRARRSLASQLRDRHEELSYGNG